MLKQFWVIGIIFLLLALSGCLTGDTVLIIDKNITYDSNNSDSNGITWADLIASYPIGDDNVADDITLTNITQITNRSYDNLQDLPNIPEDTNIFISGVSDCGAGEYVYGFNANGTTDCRIDEQGSSTDTNMGTAGRYDFDTNTFIHDENFLGNVTVDGNVQINEQLHIGAEPILSSNAKLQIITDSGNPQPLILIGDNWDGDKGDCNADGCIAIGRGAKALESDAIAFGIGTEARGESSSAWEYESQAWGDWASARHGAKVTGEGSTGEGWYMETAGDYSFGFCSGATAYAGSGGTGNDCTDDVFTQSGTMVIMDYLVGIDKLNPIHLFDIGGDLHSDGNIMSDENISAKNFCFLDNSCISSWSEAGSGSSITDTNAWEAKWLEYDTNHLVADWNWGTKTVTGTDMNIEHELCFTAYTGTYCIDANSTDMRLQDPTGTYTLKSLSQDTFISDYWYTLVTDGGAFAPSGKQSWSMLGGVGISTSIGPNITITNTGVTGLIAGYGLDVNSLTGDVNLSIDEAEMNAWKQNEIGSDCSSGDYVYGVNDDGTLDCSTPGGGGGGVAYDRDSTMFSVGTIDVITNGSKYLDVGGIDITDTLGDNLGFMPARDGNFSGLSLMVEGVIGLGAWVYTCGVTVNGTPNDFNVNFDSTDSFPDSNQLTPALGTYVFNKGDILGVQCVDISTGLNRTSVVVNLIADMEMTYD